MSLPTTIGGLPSTPAEGPPWSRRGNRASATEFARETVYDAAMTPAATTNAAVEGTIERVTYHNADNGFAVLQLDVRGRRDPVTVVGYLACAAAGEFVEASGRWVIDRQHGRQLRADSVRTTHPRRRRRRGRGDA